MKIKAGNFTLWLNQICSSLKTHDTVVVSCGTCRACCSSSYFIHIKSSEEKTLSKIPKELLFKAPGLPKGSFVLGYNEDGQCPMFVNNECSIYEDRPQTCCEYDCRLISASGLFEDNSRPLINRQAAKWEFEFDGIHDKRNFDAVKLAAEFLNKFKDLFPKNFVPKNVTQQSILSIKVYKVFLNDSINLSELTQDDKILEIVNSVTAEYERFEKSLNE